MPLTIGDDRVHSSRQMNARTVLSVSHTGLPCGLDHDKGTVTEARG